MYWEIDELKTKIEDLKGRIDMMEEWIAGLENDVQKLREVLTKIIKKLNMEETT